MKHLGLSVNYWNLLFLIFQTSKNFAIYHYIKGEFTPLSQIFQPFLSFYFQCVSGYMCRLNLTMTFPPNFLNYATLNWLVDCFYWFTTTPTNKLVLDFKPHWSTKRKKNIMWDMVARKSSAKKASLKMSQNSHKNTCARVSL